MKTNERILVYGLLALLTAINLSSLLGGVERAARADGPAPSVQDAGEPVAALTLLGDTGGAPLVLRNRGRRLAWGETAHERVHSQGLVYIGRIMSQLMQAESREEDRQRLGAELSETDADYTERLTALRDQIQAMDPQSEEALERKQAGQALYQEYVNWQQQAMARRGKLHAEQLEASYRELIEAVEVVADRRGIDVVMRFIPTEEPFDAETPEQAMLAIRLRSALRSPEGLDITDLVIEELSLEVR